MRRAWDAEERADEAGVGPQVRALLVLCVMIGGAGSGQWAPASPYVSASCAEERAYLALLRQPAEVPVEADAGRVGRDEKGRAVAAPWLPVVADEHFGHEARAGGGGGHPLYRGALSAELLDRPSVTRVVAERFVAEYLHPISCAVLEGCVEHLEEVRL